ncbi:polyprenyl synthetase family protein [Streptomyces tagetis]|uniref:Polyprenyl synthetase family protein n=1 Tax=Streptomyces tagetis TaxID=2820809 RepID=A0A940XH96_9ACTN|nr:polyprenyl synthetase family protein [Streptomyces sp. RG38]MBQ0827147.1 polyprenyl synthetase family protein [Streptomyces sp. RG38]
MSYLDLHRRMAAGIEAETDKALGLLGPSAPAVRTAVSALLADRTFTYPLSVLPLLVHAAETGDPEPALPLAVVHQLWWTSACCLDDLADSQGAYTAGDLDDSEALLATVIAGTPLPLLVVGSDSVPEALRGTLAAEIVRCWVDATEGQLRDLAGQAEGATRDSVTEVYLGKSGAPFGMVTAMAATLAGADATRVGRWRRFGEVFGILWQLFNDQDDILTGRNEDLRNGTVTYLLACALDDGAAPVPAGRITALHTAAQGSADARTELTGVLLDAGVLRRFEADVDAFRGQAHRLLDELGGHEGYVPALRDLVDRASQVLLRPAARPETVSAARPETVSTGG